MRIRIGPGERWAIVAAISYTTVNVILRAASARTDPFVGSILRQIPVATLAWAVVLATGAHEFRRGDPAYVGGRLLGGLVLGGFLSFFIGNVLFFRALDEGGLGITVNGAQAGAVLAGLSLSALILRERPRQEQVAGALVIAAGLGLVALAQLDAVREHWYVGLLFALLAGSCYAASNVVTRAVQRSRPALFVTLAAASIGGLIPLALAVAARGGLETASAAGLDLGTALAVLLAGCVNALALVGLTRAMKYVDVATTNTLSSSQVLWSFIAAVVLFGEVGSLAMIAGVICVVAGIVLAQVDRKRSRRVQPIAAVAAPTGEVEVDAVPGGPATTTS